MNSRTKIGVCNLCWAIFICVISATFPISYAAYTKTIPCDLLCLYENDTTHTCARARPYRARIRRVSVFYGYVFPSCQFFTGRFSPLFARAPSVEGWRCGFASHARGDAARGVVVRKQHPRGYFSSVGVIFVYGVILGRCINAHSFSSDAIIIVVVLCSCKQIQEKIIHNSYSETVLRLSDGTNLIFR